MSKLNRMSRTTAARATFALAAVLVAGAFDVGATARAQGAWCATYAAYGATNCGFYTWDQCRAAISGAGGMCSRNLYAVAGDQAPRRKPRRVYR
jgi:hypothetical protein